jgi:hypothetical protein
VTLDFEHRVRSALSLSTQHVHSSTTIGDETIRVGRSRRHRRRVLMSVGGAAAARLLVPSLIQMNRAGPTPGPEPAVTTPPAPAPATPEPSASPAPSPSASWSGGLSILDSANTIHTATDRPIVIPVPAGTNATGATSVAGGWVVDVAAPNQMATVIFLADDGSIGPFEPSIAGDSYAFSADRTRMAALVNGELVVFGLPSMAVLHRTDWRNQGFGQPTSVWYVGDRVVVQYVGVGVGVGDGGGGGAAGLVVWNVQSGATKTVPGVLVADIADDGSVAVLARQVGFGLSAVGCVSLTEFVDQLDTTGDPFCGPAGATMTGFAGSVSPDGQWLALITASGPYSDIAVYRLSDVRSGRAEPVTFAQHYPELGHVDGGWDSGNHLILHEERMHWALQCDPGTGQCVPVTLPPSPMAILT